MSSSPTSLQPLHVVAYTDAAGVGGAEISLKHLIAHASPDVKITLIGVTDTVLSAIRSAQTRSIQVTPKAIPLDVAQHLRLFQKLRPDIIHFNCCTPWANAIGLTAALMVSDVRIVRVDQLPLRTTDAFTLWRTRGLCLRVDAHVAVGAASARRMEDFYALGRDAVVSIANGVPDVVPPQPPVLSFGALTVGSLGRLDAMKAHDVLIRAVALVERVRVVILGDGAERAALAQLATDLGVRERVQFMGWVNEPRSHLADFDVVALPSRSEGFPLAMVEAMLAARPVVATRVGSIPEAILDHQTGILIEKNDVAGLAEALRQLRDQPQLRLHLGEQARLAALRHWTAETMSRHYHQLWQNLLTKPPQPRLRVTRPRD